ncbi:ferredoxin [Streptomyces sp. NPDC050287]|uniref:ferredoxin n=1 Tax=Streptomyces sp. NPDC050287 TaxID=3365608 RepID=UPI003798588F
MTAVRITTEPERCVGAGQCALTDPDLFGQDDDGIVELLTDGTALDADTAERAREAAALCPAAAIALHPAPEPGAA